MGGVLTDANGRTTVDGLWACGETASTGAHGANRLASNSLLEAVVFAARVASDVGEHFSQPQKMLPAERPDRADPLPAENDVAILRRTMSEKVGVVRDRAGLVEALSVIAAIEKRTEAPRLLDMLATARLIAAAALQRTESRGGHYRSDFPEPDEAWRHRTFISLAEAEQIAREAVEP
jgi:L-aspartate oxidase